MKPGEIITKENSELKLNENRTSILIQVSNTGDRPIQIGSHYHFAEANEFLEFDRNTSRGMRLNIPSGTAVRFEPGQTKDVELIEIGGERKIFGFNKKIMGNL
jgi:urease, beta subunit